MLYLLLQLCLSIIPFSFIHFCFIYIDARWLSVVKFMISVFS